VRFFALLIAVLAMTGSARAAQELVEFSAGTANLKAYLFQPGGAGPFPAIVALHDCGGLGGTSGPVARRYRDWAERLAGAGFAVLFPDSFASRGFGSQCKLRERQVRVARERVTDAVAARRWLQAQKFVAPDRVSLIGWSNGAIAALWTVRRRGNFEENGPDFRSAVALYPACRRLRDTEWSARVPTLILVGSADDWAPPGPCEQMVASARGRSAQAAIVVYAGAHHQFDHPDKPLSQLSGLAFSADGSGKVHVGTNPAARADAIRRVPQWLAR